MPGAAVRKTMAELAKSFPEGVSYNIAYDPTVFVRSSIEAGTTALAGTLSVIRGLIARNAPYPGAGKGWKDIFAPPFATRAKPALTVVPPPPADILIRYLLAVGPFALTRPRLTARSCRRRHPC